MNASIVGSATLFSGLERYHNVEKSRLYNVSSQLSFEETKLELGIDVMTLYFQILLDKATISSLGLETMKENELVSTDGGSLVALAVVAACCLLLTGCGSCTSDHQETTNITVEDGGVVVIVNADVTP